MASIGAAAGQSSLGLTFETSFLGGIGGMALIAAAGFIDQRFIMPKILGDRSKGRPRELLGIPDGGQTSGDPRIWAIGRRIRVPAQILFESQKVRESSVSGSKGGVAGQVRRVFADLAISLNDRFTERATQFIANGKLVWWSDRNLNSVRTSNMVVSTTGGRLVLTMSSSDDPDFADHFDVDHRVILSDFAANGGPNVNGYWKVQAVTHHGATPSVLTLDKYGGQSVTALAATAGTEQAPAAVTKVADAFVEDAFGASGALASSNTIDIEFADVAQHDRFAAVFSAGDIVKLAGWSANNNIRLSVSGYDATGITLFDNTASLSAGALTSGTSTNAGRILFYDAVGANYVPGMFATNPALHFHQGTDEDDEDDIIARTETAGTIPGFRGLCYQVFDTFDYSTYFGNNTPLFEALLEPDPRMTWREAIVEVCERSGLTAGEVDVAGVTGKPFEGMYLLGAMAGVQALQPILMAGQIVTQERDGTIAFFQIENADVVQIENGARFSDLSTRSGAGTPNSGDKIRLGRVDLALLPTRVEVTFQDVDNVYARGSAPFGMRNPTAQAHRKEEELDLSMLAMTAKSAKNLAATVLRRTWINSDTVELELPVAYAEVIENDLLTVTDDDGNDILCRVVRRDMGANFVVAITAVREHLSLAVHGSPVQRPTQGPPIIQAATPVAHILDIPPLFDADRFVPAIYLTACAPRGGHWGGATIYESRDGGVSYQNVGSISAQAGIGVTTTDLDAGDHGELVDGTVQWDTVNTFDIQLENDGPFPLATSTEADVLLGVNWMCVDVGGGDFEILGARDVTDNGGGSYTLSHLLRGLRGTFPSADATKAAGTKVTLLFLAPTFFHPLGDTDVPATRRYKLLAPGQALADVEHIDCTAEGWNARPMVVRDFDVDVDGSNNITFTMRHWSRVNHPVGFTGPFALDEAFEGYRIRIYDTTGTTLKRVKHKDARGSGSSTLANPTLFYSAGEQGTDLYTPATPLYVEIEQLGDFGINTDSGVQQRRGGRTYRQNVI